MIPLHSNQILPTMKQIISTLTLIAAVFFSGCQPVDEKQIISEAQGLTGELMTRETPVQVPDGEPFSKQKVDDYVKEIYLANGDFRWEQADFKMLWSAVQYGDQTVAIGYQPAGYVGLENSMMVNCPPGFRTRRISRRAHILSVKLRIP